MENKIKSNRKWQRTTANRGEKSKQLTFLADDSVDTVNNPTLAL